MPTLEDYHEYGQALENALFLRTSPLAVDAGRQFSSGFRGERIPLRDRGHHLAQCQAFAISRRQGKTVAMLKEDNWCWGPLFAYGLIEPSIADGYPELQNDIKVIPLLEYGDYIGIVSAPLKTAGFTPDLVMIYATPGQLRHMLHVLSFIKEGTVDSPIYPVASCALSVVPALQGKKCVTLPDPGDVGRALAGEDEVIFSLPAADVEHLASQLTAFNGRGMGYRDNSFLEMRADFPRPDFYKRLFRECGLDADDVPTWPER